MARRASRSEDTGPEVRSEAHKAFKEFLKALNAHQEETRKLREVVAYLLDRVQQLEDAIRAASGQPQAAGPNPTLLDILMQSFMHGSRGTSGK